MLPRAAAALAGEERKIVLQFGDFGFWPRMVYGREFLGIVQTICAREGMEFWFLDGNHEDHETLGQLADLRRDLGASDVPAKVPVPGHPNIYWLQRGYRWAWHGRRWLALGGATSLDRDVRTEGVDYFPAEEIREHDIRAALPPGAEHADVMVTHDCPSAVVHTYPEYGFPPAEKDRAARHAHRLQGVVNRAQPAYLVHGHLHTAYTRLVDMPYGQCVVTGLACDGMKGSWAPLDVRDMTWHPVA